MRTAVFMPNWIGDVVMSTPAVRALREHVGAGELVGVMRPYVSEVLAGSPWFDEIVLYQKGESQRAVWQRLRAAKLDVAVVLTNSLRTGWMAYMSGAGERIGRAGNLRTALLTTKTYPPRRGWKIRELPAIDAFMQIVQAAGAAPNDPRLELAVRPEDERAADAAWARRGLPMNGPVAVLNTGGAFGAAKNWTIEGFAGLARRLTSKAGMHVLVNCGPAERESVRQIVEAAGDPRVSSLADEPELPIGLTKAVIKRASLLVTTDSGPRFFGVAFGVPTVTLFGPMGHYLTRTYNGVEIPVSLGLDCQPCMERVCPLKHHRCMRDLSVERVYAAVEQALGLARRAAA